MSKLKAALAPYSKFIVALIGVVAAAVIGAFVDGTAKSVGQFVAVAVAAIGVYLKANAPKPEVG